jgi:hypothetical protein
MTLVISPWQFSLRRRRIRCFLVGASGTGQFSTHLRQKGYKQDWMHDFIASGVIR